MGAGGEEENKSGKCDGMRGVRERQTQAGLSEEVPEVQLRDKVTASGL